jgi:hypothetical protein
LYDLTESEEVISDILMRDYARTIGEHSTIDWARAVGGAIDLVISANSSKSLLFDDKAAFALVSDIWSGAIGIDLDVSHRFAKVDKLARSMANSGMVAGLVQPAASKKSVQRVKTLYDAIKIDPCAALGAMLSRELHGGHRNVKVNDKVRAVANRVDRVAITIDDVEVTKGGIAKYCPSVRTYWIAGIYMVVTPGSILFLDDLTLSDVARVLWMAGLWVVYGMNYHKGADRGSWCAKVAMDYLRNTLCSVCIEDGTILRLAKRIKTEYAIFMARFGYNEAKASDRELADVQSAKLREEAEHVIPNCRSWEHATRTWTDAERVDFGQLWQLLPCPDIDHYKLDRGLELKMNAERVHDPAAWSDFLTYCRGVITAHVILGEPAETFEGTWVCSDQEADPEEYEWVINCREGNLTYPDRHGSEFAYITHQIEWTNYMEHWHWAADDVTHVIADKEHYRSDMKMPKLSDSNELVYALTHGNILSKRYTVEEVRKGMDSGACVGDRVHLLAGKAENAKYPGTQRDTHSADDVSREIYSEFDRNISSLSAMVSGVAMRAGRQEIEYKMNRITADLTGSEVLLSLDITGWSPNAPREREMEFCDMLADFFVIPHRLKLSEVFKDPLIISHRRGYHRSWVAKDGSVQGFFGGSDSIMHSLMIRWAFRRAKEDGHIRRSAHIHSMAMIDDMIARVEGIQATPSEVAEIISSRYSQLGYTVDMVKSLASETKGVFLNRLYSNGREVITASKIFCKIDREWNRRLIDCWSIADSILGSAASACDRGAPVAAAYVNAFAMILEQFLTMGLKWTGTGTQLSAYAAWLPRVLGGWGCPNVVQWMTRESAFSIESGLSSICTIVRTLQQANDRSCADIYSLLDDVSKCSLEKRTSRAVIDNPLGVERSDIVDPSSVSKSLLSMSLRKLDKDPLWDRLFSHVFTAEYSALLESATKCSNIPAALLQEFGNTLPHSIVQAMQVKFERNELLLSIAPMKSIRKAMLDLRRANRMAVMQFYRKVSPKAVPPSHLLSGSVMAFDIRRRQMDLDGVELTWANNVSMTDILVPHGMSDTAMVKVYVPERTSLYDGVPGDTIVRSKVSHAVYEPGSLSERTADPIAATFNRMMAIRSFCENISLDFEFLSRIYSVAWLGKSAVITLPTRSVITENPNRLSQRMSRRMYSVSAFPNTAARAKVDAHNAMTFFDSRYITFDVMSLIYTMKAWALISLDVSAPLPRDGDINFTVRTALLGLSRKQSTMYVYPEVSSAFTGVLGSAHVKSFVAYCQNISSTCIAYDAEVRSDGIMNFTARARRDDAISGLSRVTHEQFMSSLAKADVIGILSDEGHGFKVKDADVEVKPRSKSAYALIESLNSTEGVSAFLKLLADVHDSHSRSRDSHKRMARWHTQADSELVREGALFLHKMKLLERIGAIGDNTIDDICSTIHRYLYTSRSSLEEYWAASMHDYEERRSNPKNSVEDRMYAHFMAHVMNSWVKLGPDKSDSEFAMEALYNALHDAVTAYTRRFTKELMRPTAVDLYFRSKNQTAGPFGNIARTVTECRNFIHRFDERTVSCWNKIANACRTFYLDDWVGVEYWREHVCESTDQILAPIEEAFEINFEIAEFPTTVVVEGGQPAKVAPEHENYLTMVIGPNWRDVVAGDPYLLADTIEEYNQLMGVDDFDGADVE